MIADYFKAILLAAVEGVTEFLPISSTGHLILVDSFVQLGTKDFADAFNVIIQLPAILAVVVYFFPRLWPLGAGPEKFNATILLWTKIVIAFLPAAVLGFLFDDFIEEKLFNPGVVAAALIAGGIALLLIERLGLRPRFTDPARIGYATAIGIGFIQCLAMIPGTSRSAATILGAMALGLARPAAAEFSFFLAIPTMLGAATLSVAKRGADFTPHEWTVLALGCVVSFIVAYGVVAWLMRFIQRHDFSVFGYYRIALGLVVIAALFGGIFQSAR